MRRSAMWLPLVLVAVIAADVLAQPTQPGNAVQLPTFSFFNTSTTVSVPDRGSALMGGVSRAADGRNEFGVPILGKVPFFGRPFKNTGIGNERSSATTHVSAYIHDLNEMDEYILSQPPTTQSLSGVNMPRSAIAAMGRQILPRDPGAGSSWEMQPASQPAMTVADAQSRRETQQTTRAGEAEDFFARAQQAEAEGKANVARIYYQMAARRATGALKDQVLAKLDEISRARTGAAVVQSGP